MIYHYLQLNGSGGEITVTPGITAEMGRVSIAANVDLVEMSATEIVTGLVASATIAALAAATEPGEVTTL